jgi:hypothetical protein
LGSYRETLLDIQDKKNWPVVSIDTLDNYLVRFHNNPNAARVELSSLLGITEQGGRRFELAKSIKEMKIKFLQLNILAIALPSLRTSPRTWLVAMGILAIVLLGTGALLFNVMYIQSIGSGLSILSELFNNFLYTKSSIGLEEISLLLLSLVPVKPADDNPSRKLTKEEKAALSLSEKQKVAASTMRLSKPGDGV